MGARQSQEDGPTVTRAPPVVPVTRTSVGRSMDTGSLSGSHRHAVTLQDIALSRAQRDPPRQPPSRPHHSHSLRGNANVGSNGTYSSHGRSRLANIERDRGREVRAREGDASRVHSGHSRPAYVDVNFAIPSLDHRRVPRPRPHNSGSSSQEERRRRLHTTGTHDGGHHRRVGGERSSSAPLNSLVFVRARGLSMIKCPLCGKEVGPTGFEEHLVSCVTRPRVSYNVDTLQQDCGECCICLDDMLTGDEIARLPCLCVYHVKCLQQWYQVSQTCPEHPEINHT